MIKEMKNKGQMTMVGIVIIFATLVVYASLYPALANVIETFTNASSDTMLNIIISLVPLLILLGIIITIFMYVTPQQQY